MRAPHHPAPGRLASWSLGLVVALLAPAPASSADLERGRKVYNARCYFCHGYSGDARTVAASVLQPPPRDFTSAHARRLSRERMLEAVRDGRPGTAMQGFGSLLAERDLAAVVDFVRAIFMAAGGKNINYHSPVNGWTGDPHDSPAAPFASGALALDTPWESLDARQRAGREVFLSACVSCHARGPQTDTGPSWRHEAVTYPEGNYVEHDDPGSRPATAVFERHSRPPVTHLDPAQAPGERVFAANCAACHAGDGSGRNWTGSFLDPAPPDFTRPHPEGPPHRARLLEMIRDGLPGSAMPAWRHALDESGIRAVADYLVRVFPRFRPPDRARNGPVAIPD